MDDSKLVEVYRAKDGIEAALIQNALEDAGIRVRVEGDLLQRTYGVGNFLSPRIIVFETDAARANEILSTIRSKAHDRGDRD
jgi:Putative prokaryotic signal transducing protein